MKNMYVWGRLCCWVAVIIIGLLPATGLGQITYTDQAQRLGIDHSYGANVNGGGVSFYDFDQDGWDDLTLATDNGQQIHFYRNIGGSFERVDPAFITSTADSKHIMWVDFDNDGDKDLYVTYWNARNRLYQNDGTFQFTDITDQAGLSEEELPTLGAAWGDYDRDGWLDLYVTDRRVDNSIDQATNRLYRNTGQGTFNEVTTQAHVADSAKLPFCASFVDINNDGWQDLFVVQDLSPLNTMLRNNGNGTYTDISIRSGAHLPEVAGMGIGIGDCDQNGYLDIYVTNMPPGNKLILNNGDETFTEVADQVGVGFYGIGWSTNFLDYDLDLDLDIYVSGSLVGTESPSSAFYENADGVAFTTPPTIGFEADTLESYANAIGDLNNDGYPDIVVANRHAPTNVWQNSGGAGNWLKVALEGDLTNRDGTGSTIEVHMGGKKYIRSTHCGIGFMGQNTGQEPIGMGGHAVADCVVVNWVSGHRDVVHQVAAGQVLNVKEGSTAAYQPQIQVKGSMAVCQGQPLLLHAGLFSHKLTYSWSTGQTTPSILVTEAGQYTVRVTGHGVDYEGTINVTLTELALPSIELQAADVACHSGADGAIHAVVTEGTAPYYIEWSTEQTGTSINGLKANTYMAFVVDANECFAEAQVKVKQPVPLNVAVQTQAADGGQANGSAVAIPNGGVAPYTYQWYDPAQQTTATATNLAAGTFDLLVTDANGCIFNRTVSIEAVTGLNDAALAGVSVFPTLLNNTPVLNIELPQGRGQYVLYAPTGQLLQTGSLPDNVTQVALPVLQPGMYHIAITLPNGQQYSVKLLYE